MNLDAIKQLIELLEQINQIEESDDFEGPPISGRLLLARHRLKDMPIGEILWEDHVIGEIGRACDKRKWRTSSSGPYLVLGEKVFMFNIEKRGGLTKASELLAASEGKSLALTASIAYRDALKGASA